MSNTNSPNSPDSSDNTPSFPIEEDEDYDEYDEQWETYDERYHDDEADEVDEDSLPRIYCTICSQMVEPSLYISHIQEHIDVFREVSSSFHTISNATSTFARLPHFHSLLDFPPLTPMTSMTPMTSLLSNPLTRTSTPTFTSFTQRNDNDIQGISFSNVFAQTSYPVVFTSSFQIQYNDDPYDDYEANMQLADLIGKVEVGVSDIERVSTKVHKDNVDDDASCPICMENIKQCPEIQSCRVTLCKHTYCDECISRWLKTSKQCPVCKVDLEEKAKDISI
jgi:hypothetical protein